MKPKVRKLGLYCEELTLNNKGRRLLQMNYRSGAGTTSPQRKGRRLKSKYPLLTTSKNKL